MTPSKVIKDRTIIFLIVLFLTVLWQGLWEMNIGSAVPLAAFEPIFRTVRRPGPRLVAGPPPLLP
jgi:hypothetical protein